MRSLFLLAVISAAVCMMSGCEGNPRKARSRPNRAPVSAIGQPAPETEGEDLNGVFFRLSDYKGKVVLLDFWGMWCGYCVKFLPHGKQLVEQYKDRPFVALGVNTDGDTDWPKQSKNLAMRCWADRATNGPISRRWGISGFPALYIIDHEGVIREVIAGYPASIPELDAIIEQLVQKAEGK